LNRSFRALQLNPLHPGLYHFSFARLHYHEENYQQTIADVENVWLPHFYWTHMLTAALADNSATRRRQMRWRASSS
jgi:hypothetical protein